MNPYLKHVFYKLTSVAILAISSAIMAAVFIFTWPDCPDYLMAIVGAIRFLLLVIFGVAVYDILTGLGQDNDVLMRNEFRGFIWIAVAGVLTIFFIVQILIDKPADTMPYMAGYLAFFFEVTISVQLAVSTYFITRDMRLKKPASIALVTLTGVVTYVIVNFAIVDLITRYLPWILAKGAGL